MSKALEFFYSSITLQKLHDIGVTGLILTKVRTLKTTIFAWKNLTYVHLKYG